MTPISLNTATPEKMNGNQPHQKDAHYTFSTPAVISAHPTRLFIPMKIHANSSQSTKEGN
jgi:hypothetical protein